MLVENLVKLARLGHPASHAALTKRPEELLRGTPVRKKALPIKRFLNFCKVLPHMVAFHYASEFDGDIERIAEYALKEKERLEKHPKYATGPDNQTGPPSSSGADT